MSLTRATGRSDQTLLAATGHFDQHFDENGRSQEATGRPGRLVDLRVLTSVKDNDHSDQSQPRN